MNQTNRGVLLMNKARKELDIREKNAFTLIELIVVMAIIAILVLLAAPSFSNYTKDAKVTTMKQDTKVLSDAAEMHYANNNKWPVDKSDTSIAIGLGGVEGLYPIDENEIESSIKNIKGDYSDYGLSTAGKYEGQVFHLNGVKDKKGRINYSANLSKVTAPYSDEEIRNMIDDGYIAVSTAEDLDKVRNDLSGKYIQTADIDLSNYSTGEGWEPIGTATNKFKGEFDGGKFEIKNLTINRPTTSQGLFGVIHEAEITNVIASDANVAGESSVGTLVGYATESTIRNTEVSGNVKVTAGGAGGLVGQAKLLSIRNSGASVNVNSSAWNIGGLIGRIDTESNVLNSYSLGNVSGQGQIGGLVGHTTKKSIISNSYAQGSVTGVESTAGLVGLLRDESQIINSYSSGKVISGGDGFVNSASSNAIIKNSYWDTISSGKVESLLGTPKTTSELYQQSTYKNWDFDNIWTVEEDKGYPILQWENK